MDNMVDRIVIKTQLNILLNLEGACNAPWKCNDCIINSYNCGDYYRRDTVLNRCKELLTEQELFELLL